MDLQIARPWADDLIIKVPVGTIRMRKQAVLLQIWLPLEKVVVAKGKGGLVISTLPHPQDRCQTLLKARSGEEFNVLLELKLLADVGLIGFRCWEIHHLSIVSLL